MFEKSLFGKLFDFNGDGELDSLEKSIALGAFIELTSDDKEANDESGKNSDDDF